MIRLNNATSTIRHPQSTDERSSASILSPILPQSRDIQALEMAIESAIPEILETQQQQPALQGLKTAVCIDRGCGDGEHSQRLIDAFARSVKRFSSFETVGFCSERWPGSFAGLAARTRRESPSQLDTFKHMVCGSFLDQLLPSDSAMLVTSNAALHWLDMEDASASSAAVVHRDEIDWESLAAAQWKRLLRNVARELCPGGKFLVSFVGCGPGGEAAHAPLELLRQAIMEVTGVSRSEARRAVPIYLRSEAEVVTALQDSEIASWLRLDWCRVETMECPYFSLFRTDCDSDRLATHLTRFIRGFSYQSLLHWLEKKRDRVEAGVVCGHVYDWIRREIREHPEVDRWTKHSIRVSATCIA